MKHIEFSEWLQDEIRLRGMSRAELSRSSGISKSQISKILNMQSPPGVTAVHGIAHALALPPDYLMRKAGLLSSTGDSARKDPRHEELVHLFDQLPEERKSEFIDQLRWQVSRLTRSGE